MKPLAPAGPPPVSKAALRRRRRARPCAGPRLYVPGEEFVAATSTYIEGAETRLTLHGHTGRIVSWTAEEWDALGAMQPTDTMRLAGGVRALYFAD